MKKISLIGAVMGLALVASSAFADQLYVIHCFESPNKSQKSFEAMENYYESRGFENVDWVDLPDGRSIRSYAKGDDPKFYPHILNIDLDPFTSPNTSESLIEAINSGYLPYKYTVIEPGIVLTWVDTSRYMTK